MVLIMKNKFEVVEDLVYPLVFHLDLSLHITRHKKSVNFSL